MLALPFLLIMMGLIVNFGAAAAWKVRALTVARQVVWRQRYPRTGATDPRMAEWPSRASFSVTGGDPAVFSGDRFSRHIALRGPTFTEPGDGRSFRVNTQLLDINNGLERGNSDIQVRNALLPRMTSLAPRYRPQHELLDSQWRYHEMGLSDNFWNRSVSIPGRQSTTLYSFPYGQDVQSLAEQYFRAKLALQNAPFLADLTPLYPDDELNAYLTNRTPDLLGNRAPDFHREYVNLIRGCSLDFSMIQQTEVQQAVRSIQGRTGGGRGGLPDNMARVFIQAFRNRIQYLQTLMPPPQAEIDQLQNKIDQLTRFQSTLN